MKFIREHKGKIAALAALGAVGAATYYGGPAAGKVAAQFLAALFSP